MKRKKPTGLMSNRKKTSSMGNARTIEPVLPKKQDKSESNGTSLVFFKKTPVTFQLSR
jgi:hypothetical protein